MTPLARTVRHAIFATFAEEGRAPSPAELAARLEMPEPEVREALRELHDAHAIVLTAAGDAVRMAHPFSAAPMGFVLCAGDRMWWGGCAWDSFGISAAMNQPVEIITTCPGCGTELRYAAPPERDDLVVHIPKPAAEWWGNVVDTCTHIRAYCSRAHLDSWLARTGLPFGTTASLQQLHDLAGPWYGDRLDPRWEPHTREHNQALLDGVGLTGEFWALP